MPAETSSASSRISLSTRARWTGVACGTEVREREPMCFPSAPRSRCRRFSGSGRSLDSHETSGQPVAWPARIRVDRSMAETTVGTPAASASACSMASIRCAARDRGLPVPHSSLSRPATVRRSASRRCLVDFLSATRRAISARSAATPSPWRALIAWMGTSASPSWSRSRRTSSTMDWRRSGGTVSMWLSTTTMTPA